MTDSGAGQQPTASSKSTRGVEVKRDGASVAFADSSNRLRAELRFRLAKLAASPKPWLDPDGMGDVKEAPATKVFEMELLAVDAIADGDKETLKARAKQIYHEYFVLLNDRWMTQAEELADDKNIPDTKEAVFTLLTTVQRMRQKRASLGAARNKACKWAVVIALASITALSMMIYWLGGVFGNAQAVDGPPQPHHNGAYSGMLIILAACLIGGLGGLVSTVSRTFSLRWRGDVIYGNQNVDTLGQALLLNILIALFEGFIFSFVLYALFLSGIVGGTLFPQFSSDVGPTPSSLSNFLATLPSSPGMWPRLWFGASSPGSPSGSFPICLHNSRNRPIAPPTPHADEGADNAKTTRHPSRLQRHVQVVPTARRRPRAEAGRRRRAGRRLPR